MNKINLKLIYPKLYSEDKWICVNDEIIIAFQEFKRSEDAYKRKMYRYKAHYSISRNDGTEEAAVIFMNDISPEKLFERKLISEKLASALNSIPEKQARRIYAHFFMELGVTEIALKEGVSKSRISESIKAGLNNMKIYLNNFDE